MFGYFLSPQNILKFTHLSILTEISRWSCLFLILSFRIFKKKRYWDNLLGVMHLIGFNHTNQTSSTLSNRFPLSNNESKGFEKGISNSLCRQIDDDVAQPSTTFNSHTSTSSTNPFKSMLFPFLIGSCKTKIHTCKEMYNTLLMQITFNANALT